MNTNTLQGSRWNPTGSNMPSNQSQSGSLFPRPLLENSVGMSAEVRKNYGGANPPISQGYMAMVNAFTAKLQEKQSERAAAAAIQQDDYSRMNNKGVDGFDPRGSVSVPAASASGYSHTLIRPATRDSDTPSSGTYPAIYSERQWSPTTAPSGPSSMSSNAVGGLDHFKLFEQLGHIRYMLEKQQEEKTGHVGEEFAMFAFVAVFTIFIIDSFRSSGR